jgi:hypothetical protein
VIPFLQSVASGQEGQITSGILDDVLHDTPASVTRQMLERFEQWGNGRLAE